MAVVDVAVAVQVQSSQFLADVDEGRPLLLDEGRRVDGLRGRVHLGVGQA